MIISTKKLILSAITIGSFAISVLIHPQDFSTIMPHPHGVFQKIQQKIKQITSKTINNLPEAKTVYSFLKHDPRPPLISMLGAGICQMGNIIYNGSTIRSAIHSGAKKDMCTIAGGGIITIGVLLGLMQYPIYKKELELQQNKESLSNETT